MKFCTAINCMDGRVQLPVIDYLRQKFEATYVDMITEPGPNRILADKTDLVLIKSIFDRIEISVKKHKSEGIAIIGHYDCAGNPTPREEQKVHTLNAVKILKKKYRDLEIIGLWIDENWNVTELKENF
ncbi:MAG: carbonic anhydrase [Acidobacteriota bacterium]